MGVNLMFEAGRLAQHRGWASAEVVETAALGSVSPGPGELVVVAPEASFSVPQAREVAALHSSGKNVVVVSSVPLAQDAMAWLPEGCTHVVGERLEPNRSLAEERASEDESVDPEKVHADAGWKDGATGEGFRADSRPSSAFETKVEILCDLVTKTINVKEWEQFKTANDLGVSLAVAHQGNLATLHDAGKAYVEQSYDMLLQLLEIEGEFGSLSEVFDAALAHGSGVAK